MAWVSVHDNVRGGKLRELAKELDTTQEEALGTLVLLWLWGLNNADKTGKLVNADKNDVSEPFSRKLTDKVAPATIADILIKTGWMDESENGSLYIHDWWQWQEQWYKAVDRREKDAKRKAAERQKLKFGSIPTMQAAESQDEPMQMGMEGLVSQPEAPAAGKKPASKYTIGFEEFWKIYPRKVDKGSAYKKYIARRNDGLSDDDLIAAAKAYAEQCKKLRTEVEYIKHAKTFLADTLPFEEFIPKERIEQEPKPTDPNYNPYAEFGGDDI